ncbi:hypothetical protein CDL15_Pgr022931 [Punica granatum]|uniref:Uncharacterized protein n=1 Tax=Punica granatum TaxID=22663 RepID=A0A218X479_PUNGR|nr:hypothetical protein CDL15_Pgr022931 [Punica granatum]PKI35803.1 hypothetical protein CRG98_043838 [Punica granatum]
MARWYHLSPGNITGSVPTETMPTTTKPARGSHAGRDSSLLRNTSILILSSSAERSEFFAFLLIDEEPGRGGEVRGAARRYYRSRN